MEPVPELGPCHGHGCDLAEEELFEASSKADELDLFSLCIITHGSRYCLCFLLALAGPMPYSSNCVVHPACLCHRSFT